MAVMIPVMIMWAFLGLIDTWWGLALIYGIVTLPFAFWLMKTFFDDMPREIEEAALVEGCSRLRVFTRITLPMMRAPLASAALFVFILNWSDYLIALLLTTREWVTIPVYMASLSSSMTGQLYGAKAALGLIAAVPPVIMGILLLFFATGTANFVEMSAVLQDPAFLGQAAMEVGGGRWVLTNEHFLWMAGALIFMGVMGKSAQFPLHVWLPDAMEGPTPVSALIHAATMVAAGVFLLARVFFLYLPSETAMSIVAHIGAFTAFFAATIATSQYDIKRILAFSTLSQLGYMVMAVGLGGTDVAMYHLSTHAFFKACLFLGAGSVIHAVHTNDMREMGGLWKIMPGTFWTFLVSTIALCGVWPLSGFWSKDGILHLTQHPPDYADGFMITLLPTVTAVLTSYYMLRLVIVTFLGKPRFHGHPHESPATMVMPMVVLAGLAVVAGPLLFTQEVIETFRTITRPVASAAFEHIHGDPATIGHALLIFGLGGGTAILVFGFGFIDPAKVKRAILPLFTFFENRWYFDDLYDWFVARVQQNVARLCNAFDQVFIIGILVNGSAWMSRAGGAVLARYQAGSVRTMVLLFLAGVAALLALNL